MARMKSMETMKKVNDTRAMPFYANHRKHCLLGRIKDMAEFRRIVQHAPQWEKDLALRSAAREGNMERAQLLIGHHANPNGKNPLYPIKDLAANHAWCHGHDEMWEYLLQQSNNTKAVDCYLSIAAEKPGMLQILLDKFTYSQEGIHQAVWAAVLGNSLDSFRLFASDGHVMQHPEKNDLQHEAARLGLTEIVAETLLLGIYNEEAAAVAEYLGFVDIVTLFDKQDEKDGWKPPPTLPVSGKCVDRPDQTDRQIVNIIQNNICFCP
jgi:hypothetical protein